MTKKGRRAPTGWAAQVAAHDKKGKTRAYWMGGSKAAHDKLGNRRGICAPMDFRRRSGHIREMANTYYVYILASKRNGTLYIGVTNDLVRRVWEHREGLVAGFTKKYAVKVLVYYEEHGDIGFAIQRETSLKRWNRKWKLDLIEKTNPEWLDLYPRICG